MRRGLRGALAAALLLAATRAAAHEVLHTVERGGRTIAVHAFFSDGEPLAYGEVQVFSPADARIPYQKGRTDRNGWVAFVPDVAGRWRVRILDSTGHGLVADIDADPAPGTASAAGAAGGPAGGAPGGAAFVLRPLAGIAAIAVVFGLLFILYRRKGTKA